MTLDALRDPVIQVVLHAGLAVLFASAARHKWQDLANFRLSLAGYAVLPESWVAPAARVVPALEAMVAGALLIPELGATAALAAAVVLSGYALAMGVNLARGRGDIDCGCGLGGEPRPIGIGLIVRNAVLVTLALAAAWPAAPRPLDAGDLFSIAAALAASILLFAGAEQAQRNFALARAQP